MTLAEVIRVMRDAALDLPWVRTVIDNDVFRLNAKPDAEYGVFAYTQQQHSGEAEGNFHRFAFTMFYVDRLTEAGDNEIEVQSVGVQTLEAIIRKMAAEGVYPLDYTMQTFTQRFLDECAGAFANVTFVVPLDTLCDE